MPDKIDQNLAFAFAEESRTAARDAVFSLKAEEEGFRQLARLFRAMANAGLVHRQRFLLLMRGKISATEENLKEAFQNKNRVVEECYPGMIEDASEASKAVKKAFLQSRKTDAEHAEFYRKAMENMFSKDYMEYYVCQICGHIHEDFAPENCPVCQAVVSRFKKID